MGGRWVDYDKMPIYPIFNLLKRDYRVGTIGFRVYCLGAARCKVGELRALTTPTVETRTPA